MRSQKVFFRLFFFVLIMISFYSSLVMVPARAAVPKSKINWTACYREFGFPFECGTVNVPLDYDNPGLAAVQIALVRLPATDPARRIGSLFFNPGGPGGSGVDFVLYAGPFIYSDEVRARFDIVGFDPRGVGRSKALRCFGNSKQWSACLTPFAFPITAEQELIWAAADLCLSNACDQRGTKIMDHMSTADVARDLDLLRQAVGDEKLNFVGYSYGSYIGITYANLFPDRFRAIVLDGVLDPIAWSTGASGEQGLPFSTRLRSGSGGMATLGEFFRLCDAPGSNSPFSGGTQERFATLAANLRANPLVITTPEGITYTFTYADLIANTMGSMYDSYPWPSLAQFLVDIEAAAAPATLGAHLYSLWQNLGFINKRGFPHYENYMETWPAITCADSDNPHAYSAWSAAAAAADAQGDYFTPVWTWYSSVCVPWPGSHEDRYVGPFDGQTTSPVLLSNTTFDPATRYQNALFVSTLLRNSRLLTVHGWGHTTPFLSGAADQAVSLYLLEGLLPDPGTIYEQDYVPFQVTTTAVEGTANFKVRAQMPPAQVPEPVRRSVHKKAN